MCLKDTRDCNKTVRPPGVYNHRTIVDDGSYSSRGDGFVIILSQAFRLWPEQRPPTRRGCPGDETGRADGMELPNGASAQGRR
jgi:hypothetical protein